VFVCRTATVAYIYKYTHIVHSWFVWLSPQRVGDDADIRASVPTWHSPWHLQGIDLCTTIVVRFNFLRVYVCCCCCPDPALHTSNVKHTTHTDRPDHPAGTKIQYLPTSNKTVPFIHREEEEKIEIE
jgi:hypothetical protein